MTAIEIKQYGSSSIDVRTWTPESQEDVYFDLMLMVGESGSEASNNFHLLIASPEGLRRHGEGEVLSERGTLVFSEFSPELLEETLERIVEECQGYSWDDSVRSLNRYFHWEFEDFR